MGIASSYTIARRPFWVILASTVLCWAGFSFSVFGQKIKTDKDADKLYADGLALMAEKSYDLAADKFEQAADRPYHRYTTPAIYMSGLARYYQEDYPRALTRFQYLLDDYAMSIYVPQATYHKGLILLNYHDKWQGGLYLLMGLEESSADQALKHDAGNAIRNFFFYQSDLQTLRDYLPICRESWKPVLWEAMCYLLYQQGNEKELTSQLDLYIRKYGKLTDRLQVLAPLPQAKRKEIRIAAMLPLQKYKKDPNMKAPTLWGVELLEGMLIALEEEKYGLDADVKLQVFDTEKDPAVTQRLLDGPVKGFKPHIIIGEVFNAPSKLIADYAQANGVLQIVPLSPSDEVVTGRLNTYLANPSISTQLSGFVKHLAQKDTLRNLMVVSDATPAQDKLADDFAALWQGEGKRALRRKINASTGASTPQILSVIDETNLNGSDAVFLVSENENLLSIMLEKFDVDSIFRVRKTRVLGMPGWKNFIRLGPESFSPYQTKYFDSYYWANDTLQRNRFAKLYESRWGQAPQQYASQGYDIVKMLLAAIDAEPELPQTYTDLLRRMKPWRGLNQNYYFGTGQCNSSVQVLRFTPSGIVNLPPWE